MKKLLAIMVAVAGLGGCATRVIESTVPFDAGEVAFINARGSATITGQAFMRQAGGGIVTCAGTEVRLIPLGGYASERLAGIYGSSAGGYVHLLNLASTENADPNYLAMQRTAVCDAEGDFTFTSVANGNYFLTSGISWVVPGSYIPEGGALGRGVTISGQDANVILTP